MKASLSLEAFIISFSLSATSLTSFFFSSSSLPFFLSRYFLRPAGISPSFISSFFLFSFFFFLIIFFCLLLLSCLLFLFRLSSRQLRKLQPQFLFLCLLLFLLLE